MVAVVILLERRQPIVPIPVELEEFPLGHHEETALPRPGDGGLQILGVPPRKSGLLRMAAPHVCCRNNGRFPHTPQQQRFGYLSQTGKHSEKLSEHNMYIMSSLESVLKKPVNEK